MTGSRPSGVPLVGEQAVAVRIADFLVRTEQERLLLFHMHLQATVDRVSPLLLDLAAMEGISLVGAVSLMYPPQDWPWRPLPSASTSLADRNRSSKGWPVARPRSDEAIFRRAFANPGVVVRDVAHPRGRFGIRPSGRVLGFTASIGPCVISSFGPLATLRLPEMLPETLMTAMPGRQLDQLVDHPAFRGRGYRVVRVTPDLGDGLPVLTFRTPLASLVTPWAVDDDTDEGGGPS